MVLVTAGGCELLSDYTDTDKLIIVPDTVSGAA
jgi:hypothetical protein